MTIYKVKTDDNRFEFQFMFNENENGSIISVDTKISYIKRLKFEKKDSLPDEKIEFDLKDCNGFVLYGYIVLKIVKSSEGTAAGIESLFYYGAKQRPVEFEGFLIYLPASSPVPVPPGPPFPDIPESRSIDTAIQDDILNDLFPYIYMRKWPGTSDDDLLYNFINYSNILLSPPGKYLINTLIQNKNDRNIMIQKSVAFIDGTDDYDPAFLDTIEKLKSPFKKIYPFYKQISFPINFTPEDLKKNVLEYFNINTNEEFLRYLQSNEYLIDKESCWQSYFALVFVMGYNLHLLNQLTEILICTNLLEILFRVEKPNPSTKDLNRLFNATICLPGELFPENQPLKDQEMFRPYAIGDLQLIKQKFLRYELGEISEIINIMQGEEKEIRNRTFSRDEESIEEKHINTNSKQDQQADTQTDLSEQIFKTITNNCRTANFSDLKTTYGPPNVFSYSGSVTYTDPDSEKKDNSKYAKEIVNRAISNISITISDIRRKLLTNETEKITISRINNLNGKSDRSGIYRWVNKVYSNYIVNYGTRLMYELLIEDPASLFINTELFFKGDNLYPPVNPSELGILKYTDISRENFNSLRIHYNNLTMPLPSETMVSDSLNGSESKMIQIEKEYVADSANIAIVVSGSFHKQNIQVVVGTKIIPVEKSHAPVKLDQETGQIPISTIENPLLSSPPEAIGDYSVNIEIKCQLIKSYESDWQLKVFKEIYADYKMQLQNYYQAIERHFGKSNISKNIRIVKQTIIQCCKQELYRNYLAKTNKPMSDNNQADFRVLQFIDLIFELNEIYFVFVEKFPINIKKKKYPLINQFNNYDEFFTQFLRADFVRVILPVRSGREMSALLFTDTGIMWDEKHAPCRGSSKPRNNDSVEISNEIKINDSQKNCTIISEPWEITIPTDMQMLNEKSFSTKELK